MHVGIILDGNRTWAKKIGLPWLDGHKKGGEALKNIIKHCPKIGIDVLTVYAFSTENFNRPPEQVSGILNLITNALESEIENCVKNDLQIKILGDLSKLPERTRNACLKIIEATKKCSGKYVGQIALAYGGQDEIVRAVNKTLQNNQPISEETIQQNLDCAVNADIIIRTSGQIRTSNFLMWQSVYAEYFFVEKNWPDFTPEDLDKIMHDYNSKRNRKFGK